MLPGLMMKRELTVTSIIEHAARVFPDVGLASALGDGGHHRYTYREAKERISSLANALLGLGVQPGDRVATLAWNGFRHFELYYAIAGIGAVCHTINPRLPREQIAYIIRHAQDRVLFFDAGFSDLAAGLKAECPADVVMVDMAAEGGTDALSYERIIESASASITWPEIDELAAAGLCYTSGTTGAPKGVLYSHRSSVLHALAVIAAGTKGLRPGGVVLPVVPLFHANAWGLAHAAPIVGASLVWPGSRLDGPSLFALMDRERVTSAWGVPTVWLGLIEEMRAKGRRPNGLREVIIGGSAAPAAMIETFENEFDVEAVHGWGMTEMSPVGTLCTMPDAGSTLGSGVALEAKLRQGRPLFGVELRIVEDGKVQPSDGRAAGELQVRGHAVAAGYFENAKATAKAFDADGWFATGDVAKLAPDGSLEIVDRVKDLIKSGGEWISSIDVENAAMSLPGVAMCAVIATPHERWGERPLLVIVRREGFQLSPDDVMGGLARRLAKWQLPDSIVFVDQLPMTPTGKVSKLKLREQLAGSAT
ncbi:MAG: long-chain fatty acid--CoA ligase [Hyphomicrobium sp.]